MKLTIWIYMGCYIHGNLSYINVDSSAVLHARSNTRFSINLMPQALDQLVLAAFDAL